jgi:peptidoglycan/LPS O-acetylase OafA/YrhL
MPFGGTYAPLFFLGMAYARWKKQIHPFIRIPAVSIFLSFEAMLIVTRGLYFARTPIITLFGWSLGFLFIVKMVIEALPNFSMIWRTLAFFGRHSLPIFLFHYITVQNFAPYLSGNWIYFMFLLLLAAGVPLLIEYAFNMGLQGIMNVNKKLALSYKL